MTSLVRPAGEGDIGAVCRLLHEQMNRKIAPERWRRLMTYGWLDDKPDLGRVALVDGEVVGYVGAVHAERELAGRRQRITNICAWYLAKPHRGRGLGFELMRQAVADGRATYTNLTSSARTLKLLDALGYAVLERERMVWEVAGAVPSLALEREGARILAEADPAERRLLRDHAGLPVEPVRIDDEEGSCLALFSVKLKGAGVTTYDALHISDPEFFGPRAQAIADALLPRDRPAALAVDARLLGGQAAGGRRETLPVARYYKSAQLAPSGIDNLYSEIPLLDLKLD